jgi:Mce-associated membrane protein
MRTIPAIPGIAAIAARRTIIALAAAVLVLLAVAGTAWYQADRGDQQTQARREALRAASSAAVAIFSYDYRTFDAGVAKAKPFVTGPFAKEYADTTASLKATAASEQAVVRAQVSASGVIDTGDGRVDLLLYLNQYRRNSNISGEKVDQNRVVLTMVRVGRAWKVSAASAI